MEAEGIQGDGANISYNKDLIRIDLVRNTGKDVLVYGQTEMTAP
ncbi:MAG: hypothetical protein QNJ20_17425 [Paracoccaceae bacterium]|nr:hypothetical protein [Paracoccaceae bacterium]